MAWRNGSLDRDHTRADDLSTYFPLSALRRAAHQGWIGDVASRFHSLPTNRSNRISTAIDAPKIVSRVRAEKAKAAILVANCSVCHQSLALVARALEAAGVVTVLMGCAKDIVEHCGVPRFLFRNFPLGNAAGRPHDRASHEDTHRLALNLLQFATAPRTTVQSVQRWSANPSWKADCAGFHHISAEEIVRRRETFEAEKHRARADRAVN